MRRLVAVTLMALFGAMLGIFGCGGCSGAKTAVGADSAPADIAKLLADVRDHDGKPVAAGALAGHWTVLWFYPKAQTSG